MSTSNTETVALAVRQLAVVPVGEELSAIDQFSLATDAYIADSATALEAAKTFTVDSEADYQFADTVQDDLKRRVKAWEEKRTPITKPLNDLVSLLVAKPGNDNLKEAIALYQSQNTAYRRKVLEESLRAQREAERQLREDRERREAEARRLEEHAATLKTSKAQERARQQAEEVRQVAAMMPETVALAVSEPQSVASDVYYTPAGEVADMAMALRWLADNPEWCGGKTPVIKFTDSGLNALAGRYMNSKEIPGFKFTSTPHYRSKAKR